MDSFDLFVFEYVISSGQLGEQKINGWKKDREVAMWEERERKSINGKISQKYFRILCIRTGNKIYDYFKDSKNCWPNHIQISSFIL